MLCSFASLLYCYDVICAVYSVPGSVCVVPVSYIFVRKFCFEAVSGRSLSSCGRIGDVKQQ